MTVCLRIEITRKKDGEVVLACIRADGSRTWQRQRGAQAAFFTLHDLTHLAVESELRLENGFFGLLSRGWSIEDTTGKGARGPLPDEAIFCEHVVGLFDQERASALRWTSDEFNDALALRANESGRTISRTLTEENLAGIRKRRAELFAQWHALPPGGTLALTFT